MPSRRGEKIYLYVSFSQSFTASRDFQLYNRDRLHKEIGTVTLGKIVYELCHILFIVLELFWTVS